MPSVRSLLTRVAKLEQSRAASRSPVELAYGSVDAFADKVNADIGANKLDPVDGPLLLNAVRRWHRDGVWQRQQARNAVWDFGRL